MEKDVVMCTELFLLSWCIIHTPFQIIIFKNSDHTLTHLTACKPIETSKQITYNSRLVKNHTFKTCKLCRGEKIQLSKYEHISVIFYDTADLRHISIVI